MKVKTEKAPPVPILVIFNEHEHLAGKTKDIHKVLGIIFERFMPKLTYMSFENVKGFLLQTAELIDEARVTLKRGGTQVFRQLRGIRTRVERAKTKQELMEYIYNTILTCEGLNTLSGFGYVAFEKSEEGARKIKARFMIDPEKTSVNFIP